MIFAWPPTGRISENYAQRDKAFSFLPKSKIAGKVGYAIVPGQNGEHAGSFIKGVMATSKKQERPTCSTSGRRAPRSRCSGCSCPTRCVTRTGSPTTSRSSSPGAWPAAAEYLAKLDEARELRGARPDHDTGGGLRQRPRPRDDRRSTREGTCKQTLNDTAKEWDTITNKLGVDKQRASYRYFLNNYLGSTKQEHACAEGPGSQDLTQPFRWRRRLPRQTTRRRPRAASSWVDRNIQWILVAPAIVRGPRADRSSRSSSRSGRASSSTTSHRRRSTRGSASTTSGSTGRTRSGAARSGVTASLAVRRDPIELVLGLILALAMLRPFRGRRVLMVLFVIPLFMSPVIVGDVLRSVPAPPLRAREPARQLARPGPDLTIDFTIDSPWTYISILVADAWQWTPFMFVILLAGLAAIPDELYEAADLDGAKPRQAFFFVTLPLLAPIILIAVTFRLHRRRQALRHHLLADAGRAGDRHLHDDVLPVPTGVPAVPSRPGHGRLVDVHADADVHRVLARQAPPEAGGRRELRSHRPVPTTRRRSSSAGGCGSGWLRFLVIGVWLVFLLLPLYWVAVASIKPQGDLLASPPVWWPAEPTDLHYAEALNSSTAGKGSRTR